MKFVKRGIYDTHCKLGGWPPFYGTGKFLWYYTWLLHHNLATCLCSILARVSLVLLCFMCKDQLSYVGRLVHNYCIAFYMDRNAHPLAETACCTPNPHYLSTNMENSLVCNFEVRHPRCVGSVTKNYCVLHIQSNTIIFHLVGQWVYDYIGCKYMFRPYL